MLLKSWTEFYEAAERLYLSNPAKTRYSVKYRHKEGKLELKVTDDKVCIKYKSDQAQDLKNIEKLTQLFLRLMTSKAELPPPTEESTASSNAVPLPLPTAAAPKPAITKQPPSSPSVKKS